MKSSASLDYAAFLRSLEPFSHVALSAPGNSDGDSVGSQIALLELLRNRWPDKQIRIINEDPCPARYGFLKHFAEFEVSGAWVQRPRPDWPQAVICVDGGEGRLGPDSRLLWHYARGRFIVDHHSIGGEGTDYAAKIWDPQASATAELVYRLAKASQLRINPFIAQGIYLGLIHDTGMFKHSNTTAEIMRIAAELLETGFNHTETAEKGLLERSQPNLLLMRELLSQMQSECAGRYMWGVVNHKAFASSGAHLDDREGLIDLLFLTPSCEIAAFYLEFKPGQWRVSFRSRGWNVAALAQSLNSSGGGHMQAAGCTLEGARDVVLANCHAKIRSMLGA